MLRIRDNLILNMGLGTAHYKLNVTRKAEFLTLLYIYCDKLVRNEVSALARISDVFCTVEGQVMAYLGRLNQEKH